MLVVKNVKYLQIVLTVILWSLVSKDVFLFVNYERVYRHREKITSVL